MGNLTFNLWDCGGQDTFMDNYFMVQRETIFKNNIMKKSIKDQMSVNSSISTNVFNKNKFIGFLTQSEQQMFAIIDENFMYQLEDKLINQQNKGLRQILKVLSLDLLIRILIYVRI